MDIKVIKDKGVQPCTGAATKGLMARGPMG